MKEALIVVAAVLSMLSGNQYIDSRTSDPLRSIVKVVTVMPRGESVCTGFVVSAAKGEALTARHCVLQDAMMTADGEPSNIVKVDEVFALITVKAMSKPPIDISKNEAKIGERVALYGFGYGSMQIIQRAVASYWDSDIVLDGPIVNGMSGGPVVNQAGKVVGLNQASTDVLGLACGAEELRKFLAGN